jgi:dynein heavy chain, axonemal
VAYEVLWGKAWQKAVEAAKVSINATVLVVHPEDGNLYVNFDSALLQVMREAKCMRPLGVEIPDLVADMMIREARSKTMLRASSFF